MSAEAVAELMARAGKDASGAMHDPRKWAVALRHSYAVAAIEVDGVLLGFARCVSDGVFSALVLDVTVDSQAAEDAEVASEALVRRLLKSRRRWGKRGPETFVVFARPEERRVYWRLGFEWAKGHKVMQWRASQTPVAAEATS